MRIDYRTLQQDPKDAARNAVRHLMRLYSEKVHFLYEFIQNAEDAGWQDGIGRQVRLVFILREHERDLLVWNDGRSFTYKDIRGICCSDIPGVQRVEVSAQVNGQGLISEEWLVFSRSVIPPPEIIEALLNEADDDDERERIERSAQKPQPIDVAFKCQPDGHIVPSDEGET